MFGIGFSEILLIAVVALLFYGPNKLPEAMRQAGKLFVYLRRTSNEFRDAFEKVIKEAEQEMLVKEREKIKKLLESAASMEPEVKPVELAGTHSHEPTSTATDASKHFDPPKEDPKPGS